MSEALPLPPSPNIDQYKKLAEDLQSACKSSDPGAVRDWAARWAEAIARQQGLAVTPAVRRQIDADAERIKQRWHKFRKTNEHAEQCTLADAQHFVAHRHGFASWPKFAGHLKALERADSPVSQFEAAVDAIVSGDSATLEKLVRENPDLVRARSTREHGSTLLHYVSANGVEDFRQKTPKNIIEIARLLLQAGADVNAESDAYGGRSTALGLTATSCHPENAGVQLPLMELLMDYGASVEGPDGYGAVNSCLSNGRGQAAEFLASRGARLDLEGAAGVGRLDVVKSLFQEDGAVNSPEMQRQMRDGLAWACEFGRTSVVEFLLQRGIAVDAKGRPHGQTGLHWAAYGGHKDAVKLLLDRSAPIDAKDEHHGGTPLEWALYAWGNSSRTNREPYYGVVAMLARAGAKLEPKWYEDHNDRGGAAEKLRSDPRMLEALGGLG
jgi:ankyrin repeat protein